MNIGDTIGLETKNYVYGKEKNTKLGFGLSPIAEGYFNLGMFGIAFTGFIYGISIGILQNYYNKITLNKINIFDLIILNSISIVPLMMRSGTAGIYNWIFSTSFILFVIIFFIEFLIISYNKIKDIS